MKYYSEEQMKEAIRMARSSYNLFTTPFMYEHDEVLEKLTPIQLPSDEEIEASLHPEDNPEQELYNDGWEDGIKWLRDKIQGGNK